MIMFKLKSWMNSTDITDLLLMICTSCLELFVNHFIVVLETSSTVSCCEPAALRATSDARLILIVMTNIDCPDQATMNQLDRGRDKML